MLLKMYRNEYWKGNSTTVQCQHGITSHEIFTLTVHVQRVMKNSWPRKTYNGTEPNYKSPISLRVTFYFYFRKRLLPCTIVKQYNGKVPLMNIYLWLHCIQIESKTWMHFSNWNEQYKHPWVAMECFNIKTASTVSAWMEHWPFCISLKAYGVPVGAQLYANYF